MARDKKTSLWRAAHEVLLRAGGGPMHVETIDNKIHELGLYKSSSANRGNNLHSALMQHIKAKDGQSNIVKLPGTRMFELRSLDRTQALNEADFDFDFDTPERRLGSALGAFGTYWDRHKVDWRDDPRLIGYQKDASMTVDFHAQNGIYVLHDNTEIINIGKADSAIGKRLKDHTDDHLKARWNRFSFFGFKRVDENGHLICNRNLYTAEEVTELLEGVLIELLEPPTNRKRGKDMAALQYFQKENSEVEVRKALKKLLGELL